jgi:hypothetical protein
MNSHVATVAATANTMLRRFSHARFVIVIAPFCFLAIARGRGHQHPEEERLIMMSRAFTPKVR